MPPVQTCPTDRSRSRMGPSEMQRLDGQLPTTTVRESRFPLSPHERTSLARSASSDDEAPHDPQAQEEEQSQDQKRTDHLDLLVSSAQTTPASIPSAAGPDTPTAMPIVTVLSTLQQCPGNATDDAYQHGRKAEDLSTHHVSAPTPSSPDREAS